MTTTANKKGGSLKDKFSIFEWVIELKNKYGILNILTSGMLIVFMSLTILIAFNPSILFDRYMAYEEEKHAESFNYRMKYSKTILRTVDDLRREVNAHRAFIIEYHNGKSNATGLSFNYGTVMYEKVSSDSIDTIGEDYEEFPLEKYPLHLYLYEHNYWCGTTEQLKSIDKKLATRMEFNGTYSMAIITIYGIKSEIGALIVTFGKDSEVHNNVELGSTLRKYATELSPFLDGENAK